MLAERCRTAIVFVIDANSLQKIPGSPVAYWLSPALADLFASFPLAGEVADARQGLATGNNVLFMRFWFEVCRSRIGFDVVSRTEAEATGMRWFPCNKGGPFRKWFGNLERVVDWWKDGTRIKQYADASGALLSRPQNQDVYFRDGITWSDVTISDSSFRVLPQGCISDATGHSAYFTATEDLNKVLCFGNSAIAQRLIKAINPKVHFHRAHDN